MFDLEFHKHVAWCIRMYSSENSSPKIMNEHQRICEKKHGYISGGDMPFLDSDQKQALMDYVYEEYMPYFGIQIVEPSSKIMSKIRRPMKGKLKSEALMFW